MELMSREATEAALTALMYAYLLKEGPDAKIPDFSASFGHRLSEGELNALLPLYETARQHALQGIIGRPFKVRSATVSHTIKIDADRPRPSDWVV